ncbi:MAG: hypothetical protein WC479_04845 [Candidatus Izemoplasmatales bacterium]|nr:hypothetical protein [Candidatus Izemoplasmatales bacterium]
MERGFRIVTKFEDHNIQLPKRKTNLSAGYDIEAAETVIIAPQTMGKVPTGLKAYMQPDEMLLVFARSSLFQTKSCIFVNGVAVIDADYYDNPSNEGHIILTLYNMSSTNITIQAGERFAQGVFQKYLKTDDDIPSLDMRNGGYGSTGQ